MEEDYREQSGTGAGADTEAETGTGFVVACLPTAYLQMIYYVGSEEILCT